MNIHQQLSLLLDSLKQSLIDEKLYSTTTPSTEALSSSQPFCVDTLEFEQWLQFVMLPKFQHLVEQGLSLPSIKQSQGMANIAEVVFTQRGIQKQAANTILTIRNIDKLLEESK